MRIAASERVLYQNSPLVEVVAQVRFDRILILESSNPAQFQESFAKNHYPKLEIETAPIFATPVGAANITIEPSASVIPRVFHFSSDDGAWKLSVSADFITLSCLAYTHWNDFKSRFAAAVSAFSTIYSGIRPTRIGLRYKDVIERQALGLGGTPWSELLKPFVIGVLSEQDFAVEGVVPDSAVNTLLCYTTLKLKECDLILQTAQMTSVKGPEKAFLIDSDFFAETANTSFSLSTILARFDELHSSAGALFRRCITDKLHHALSPTKIESE